MMALADLLARAWVHAVITCNDDFTDQVTGVRVLTRGQRFLPKRLRARLEAAKRAPLAVLCQETKNSRLRDLLPARFGVRQYLETDAMAGVAVVWDTEQAHALEAAPGEFKGPWNPNGHHVLVHPNGVAMEARGVTWQDVEVGKVGSGRIVRLAAAHRPPGRYDHLWPEFDRALAEWAAASPYPVLLGMDANTLLIHALADRTGFPHARFHKIDCVLGKGKGLRPVGKATALPKGRSDHNPIRTLWRIGRNRPERTPAEHRAEVAP